MTEDTIILALLILLLAGIIALAILLVMRRGATAPRRGPLTRVRENPVVRPNPNDSWEANAVFNPAAIYLDGRVHILYRALGPDGVSRIGYASSRDGINFDERLREPAFVPEIAAAAKLRNPFTSPARLHYDTRTYASGGGWGGSEDPRLATIDGRVYMTFSSFNGWDSIRMSVASLTEKAFLAHEWDWRGPAFLSRAREVHKNWVLFPEKLNGKFAILHAISPAVQIAYVDDPEAGGEEGFPIDSHYDARTPGREEMWDSWVRGAGPPPIKTDKGWLLLYHAVDEREPSRFKLGAMLLDRGDPTRILYRSRRPILEPDAPYENDWKPGIVYSCGAIVKDGTLFVYYGGGDKTVNVATASLKRFLAELMENGNATLKR
jgi:predicted GH43/DUF377 family glycosyl hydrolase